MPVIFNADYFDNGCCPISPQFLFLKWEWYDEEGPQAGLLRPTPPNMNVCCQVSRYYKESFGGNLNIAALPDMLDK
jgi:hypothetical protein